MDILVHKWITVLIDIACFYVCRHVTLAQVRQPLSMESGGLVSSLLGLKRSRKDRFGNQHASRLGHWWEFFDFFIEKLLLLTDNIVSNLNWVHLTIHNCACQPVESLIVRLFMLSQKRRSHIVGWHQTCDSSRKLRRLCIASLMGRSHQLWVFSCVLLDHGLNFAKLVYSIYKILLGPIDFFILSNKTYSWQILVID